MQLCTLAPQLASCRLDMSHRGVQPVLLPTYVKSCSLWCQFGVRVGRASAEAAAAGAEAEQGEVGGGARARAQGSCH